MNIGVVGPCAAGKSTLIGSLRARGYQIKHIAQEHSYVADMWRKIAKPDLLIYLYASYKTTIIRRKLNWTEKEYQVQMKRLEHAREHADLFIDTDHLSPEQVLLTAVGYLAGRGIKAE